MNRRSHAYLHTGFEHFCEALVSGWSAALRDEALARNASRPLLSLNIAASWCSCVRRLTCIFMLQEVI